MNTHWKNWCWSSNTLTTWCKELTHWKRPWCWKRLKAGGEGDYREWDGWMASCTQRTRVEQTLGVGDGQGSLACCSSWGRKESDTTEWLNWTERPLNIRYVKVFNITNYQGNTNVNHNVISPHASWDGCRKQKQTNRKWQVLAKMWREGKFMYTADGDVNWQATMKNRFSKN